MFNRDLCQLHSPPSSSVPFMCTCRSPMRCPSCCPRACYSRRRPKRHSKNSAEKLRSSRGAHCVCTTNRSGRRMSGGWLLPGLMRGKRADAEVEGDRAASTLSLKRLSSTCVALFHWRVLRTCVEDQAGRRHRFSRRRIIRIDDSATRVRVILAGRLEASAVFWY